MKKPIAIGEEFYKRIIDGGSYYVDKTLLIKEILDSRSVVTLFTRPRRFGKTLAINMLKTYFEDERDEQGNRIDNHHYFDGMKILQAGDTYTRKLGCYPVVNLSLKSAKQPTFEMAYEMLKRRIQQEYDRHAYILQSDELSEDEKVRYRNILSGNAADTEYVEALAVLCEYLKKYHKENVVVLIDEYDVPLENAYFKGFYNQMVDFMRSLFESALKTNPNLEFAIITGCLRISKESIFTGLNNLKVVSVLSGDFAEYFGFTQEETKQMLFYYGMEEQTEIVRDWYDGYLFGETEVYNPWSVLNYVNDNCRRQGFAKPYWSNTSSNSIVRELVEAADLSTKQEIERLIAGETIEKPIHEDITYEDIYESQDNLWNFLFFTGYLKKTAERQDGENLYMQMAIPNAEIRYIYRNTILSWFDKSVKALDRTPLYEAVIHGDATTLENILRRRLMESISFYDAAEQFYHGFMVGMLSGLGDYLLKSNREAGDGRPDLVMVPLDERMPVVIFEFKIAKNFTLMEQGCKEALRQIEKRHYDAEYREEGYENYIKYGICFFKKSCKIKKQ